MKQVNPVISGYRIVLTYNLVNTGSSPTPSIATGDPRLAAIQSYLKRWSSSVDGDCNLPPYLVYMLEHEYTEDSLALQALKGKDLKRVKGLLNTVAGSDCVCYLASIAKRVYGGCDGFGFDDGYDDAGTHSIADVVEESVELERIVTMEGAKIVGNVSIEDAESYIMQEDPFAKEPDEEEFEGWTGNEGANATHWYRDSAIIIMPRSCALDYLVGAVNDANSKVDMETEDKLCDVIDYYSKLYLDTANDSLTRDDLCRLVDMVVKGSRSYDENLEGKKITYGYHTIAAAARACLIIDRPLRFTQVMRTRPGFPSALFAKFMPHTSSYSFDQIREA